MAEADDCAGRKGRYHRATFVVAVISACAIFPLILVGAGVTSKDAGMIYPDWPTSNGSLINPENWTESDKTLFEHGHRLLGWCAGMLAIVLVVLGEWQRTHVRLMSWITLLAIIVQGLLGGFRVMEISTGLALVHGMWGQVCFCFACVTALLASRSWIEGAGRIRGRAVTFFRRGCVLAVVSVFMQLGFGAAYRHFASQHALIAHILWAVWLLMLLGWAAFWCVGEYSGDAIMGRLGKALAGLLVLQLLLGGAAFVVVVMGGKWSAFAVWAVPSAHVLVGAAILACVVLIALGSYHLLCPESQGKSAGARAHAAGVGS